MGLRGKLNAWLAWHCLLHIKTVLGKSRVFTAAAV
jgi:hypothetical protein